MISFSTPYPDLLQSRLGRDRQSQAGHGSGNLDGETTSIIPGRMGRLLRSSHYRTSPPWGAYSKWPGQIAGQVQEFWATPPSARALQCIPLESYSGQVGNLNTLYFPVDHSIPGSGAWAVETSEGWVVYTGDLRLHGARKGDTLHFVAQAARLRPLALICEGTHLDNEWFMSEAAVYENARLAVELSKGLVIADFSLSNMERLALFTRWHWTRGAFWSSHSKTLTFWKPCPK